MAWGGWFRRLWTWWQGQPPETIPEPEPEPIKPRRKRKEEREDTGGSYYFREDILDKLDGYFHYLRRFKHADPEAYGLFGKVGAAVLPNKTAFLRKEVDGGVLPPTWNAGDRPGFFAAFSGDWKDTDSFISARFCYFQKFATAPPTVEQTDDVVYKCVYYHDDRHPPKKRWLRRLLRDSGFATEFWMAISADNKVRLLKERVYDTHKIVHRDAKPGVRKISWVPGACHMRYSKTLTGWLRDQQEHHRNDKIFENVEAFAEHLFTFVAHEQEMANSGTQVSVRKGDLQAVFAITIERTPYFFKDRDLVVNENGRRRRIFHIVRPHERIVGNKSIMINMHFRGTRVFMWNGYRINITVPGLHHFVLPQFDIGAIEDDEETTGIPVTEIAGNVQKAIDRQEKMSMKWWRQRGPQTSAAQIRSP
jgi:hypothetical protein